MTPPPAKSTGRSIVWPAVAVAAAIALALIARLDAPPGDDAAPANRRANTGDSTRQSEPSDLEPIGERAPATASNRSAAAVDQQSPSVEEQPPGEWLRGTLIRPDGGATKRDHSVALLATGSDGSPLEEGRVVVEPAADGRFEMELPDWAFEGAVALVGRAWEHMPATLALRPARGERDDVELRLERGAELHGKITCDGQPVAGWPLELDLRFGVPGVFGAGEEGFWLDGRFVEKVARTVTDSDGRFVATGLAADRYDLRTGAMPPSVPETCEQVVHIDGQEVHIDLSGAQIALLVTGAGGPLDGATVEVACEAHRSRVQCREGRALVRVPPGAEVTLRAEHASHATRSETIRAPALGARLDVTLAMDFVVRPTLRVHLPGADAAGFQVLHIDVRSKGEPANETRLALTRDAALDTFRLAAFPGDPGPYDLRLPSILDFVSEVRVADIPKEGVVDVHFEGKRGGRYDVTVSADAERFTAQWTIEDEAGLTVVSPTYVSHSPDESFESFAFEEEFSSGPAALKPDDAVLPAGHYVLRARAEGYRDFSERFEIVSGKTARIDARLKPR